MGLTEQDSSNLLRFGCTLQPERNLLCVRWTGLGRESALAANILVRSTYKKCTAGPLACVALEISPTLALPHYCYFPFNFDNEHHCNYLTSLAQTGQLHLAFIDGRKSFSRDDQLSPPQCRLLTEVCDKVAVALRNCSPCKFADVVDEFEKTTRIAQLFERALSENELAESMASLKAKAEQLSSEKRQLAHDIVHGFADVLNNRCGQKFREFVGDLQVGRTAFLFLFDFHREFAGDYERLVDYLADSVAINTDEEALTKAREWPSKLDAVLEFFERAPASPEEKQKATAEFVAALGHAVDYLSTRGGLSLAILQSLVLPFRALLPGQLGRPTKDYSKEYEWKRLGMSWTEVAAQHLKDNAETRAEFGGRDFDFLTFEQKENLRNRIREGVRSYAERAGKPFPLPESPQAGVVAMQKS
jgi:hypothetical protein